MANCVYDEVSHNSSSILHALTESGAIVSTIVDNWIDSYKHDKSALVALLQFFVESSGCKGELTDAPDDFSDTIRHLTHKFNENTSEYPLIQNTRKWKTFKSKFCDFITCLITSSENSLLFDSYMMPKLFAFLVALTDSQVRAFRHTATFAVLKSMSALCDVYVRISTKLTHSKRQCECEEKKPLARKSAHRLSHLNETVKELNSNLSDLYEMLTYLFKAVFVLRFRDSFHEIRGLSIKEFGIWLLKLPEVFLDDSHLKYLFWSLSDKSNEVRFSAIRCIKQMINEQTRLLPKMELFFLKCKDRLVSMTLDVQEDVAVEAIQVITLIDKNFKNILSDENTESLYHLVYGNRARSAQAAGGFLFNKLIEMVNTSTLSESNHSLSQQSLIMKELIDFFIESGLHSHTAYLVDSLLDSCPPLRDWDCMTTLLIDVEVLAAHEEKVLIDMMVSSVKQCATGVPPVTRTAEKKSRVLKTQRNTLNERKNITTHFASVLPRLINKYMTDSNVLTNLLEISLYFDLSLFLVPSRSEGVLTLLQLIQVLFERHTDNELLELCIKIFDYFSNNEYALSQTCLNHLNETVEVTVRAFESRLTAWSEMRESDDSLDDLCFSFVNSAKKLSIISPFVDLSTWKVWEIMFSNLNEKAMEGSMNYPEEYIHYSLKTCHMCLLWNLDSLEEMVDSGTAVSNESTLALKNKFQSFISLTDYIIKHTTGSVSVEAFKIFVDSILIFGDKSSKYHVKLLDGLSAFHCNKIRDTLFNFLKTNVFESQSCNSIKTYENRILLSSYCKLFLYKILPVYFLSDVLPYYLLSYSDYGDIIDATVTVAKGIDIVDFARATVNSLIAEFEEVKLVDHNPSHISDLKKLARKLSSVVGAEKNDDIFIKVLHNEGIVYAFREIDEDGNLSDIPFNIMFLELLSEFSSKLSSKNKKYILNLLNEKRIPNLGKNPGDDWQPLILYKESLGAPHPN